MANDKIEFEPIEFEPIDQEDEIEFEAIEPTTPSIAESAGRGLLRGATLDFDDELGAGIKTIGDTIKRGYNNLMADGGEFDPSKMEEYNKLDPDEVDAMLAKQGIQGDVEFSPLDRYRETKARINERKDEAEEANPGVTMGTSIAGGIAPALLSGGAGLLGAGVKTAAKEASKQSLKKLLAKGAAIGAGYSGAYEGGVSDAELTKGEVGEFAGDVLSGMETGALTGAGFAGGGNLLGKVGKYASSFEPVKYAKEAFSQAAKGIPFISGESGKTAVREATKSTKKLLEKNQQAKDVYGKLVGKVLKKGKTVDLTDELALYKNDVLEQVKKYSTATDEGKLAKTILVEIENVIKEAKKLGNKERIEVRPERLFKLYKNMVSKINKTDIGEEGKQIYTMANNLKEHMLNSVSGDERRIYSELMTKLEKSHSINNFLQKRGPKLTKGTELIDESERILSPLENSTNVAANLTKLGDPALDLVRQDAFKKNIATSLGDSGKKLLKDVEQKATTLDLATKGQKTVHQGVGAGLASWLSAKGAGTGVGALAGTAKKTMIKELGLDTNLVKGLVKANPLQLEKISRIVKNPKTKQQLLNLAQMEGRKKKATLFILSQNPEFREAMGTVVGLDKDKDK